MAGVEDVAEILQMAARQRELKSNSELAQKRHQLAEAEFSAVLQAKSSTPEMQ